MARSSNSRTPGIQLKLLSQDQEMTSKNPSANFASRRQLILQIYKGFTWTMGPAQSGYLLGYSASELLIKFSIYQLILLITAHKCEHSVLCYEFFFVFWFIKGTV